MIAAEIPNWIRQRAYKMKREGAPIVVVMQLLATARLLETQLEKTGVQHVQH